MYIGNPPWVAARVRTDTTPPDSLNSSVDQTKDTSENQGVQIDLRVDPGPVWLSVETDGTLAFSGTMLSGSVQTFKAQDKIVISSGKGNATFVKLNGQDAGALSENAVAVREVTFTKDTKSRVKKFQVGRACVVFLSMIKYH